jgi:DNA modification methylase
MSNTVRLLNGDCLQKLKELKDNSVDSVVTDPPYHLISWDIQPKKKYKRNKKGFMGKEWDGMGEDGIGIANNPQLWKEVLRVLKPGGHLLSFSHSRTYHRQAVAVEDAGFEIRDQIMWIYGSGFPKSHNIGKSVDKIQGNDREVVGENPNVRKADSQKNTILEGGFKEDDTITKGNSPYEGWGTALKPAHEPIVMARKPFKGTVAKNVLEHGTGGINIDGCRVGSESRTYDLTMTSGNFETTNGGKNIKSGSKTVEGRFPANIIFDEEAGKILDEQSGTTKSSKRGAHNNKKTEHTNTYTPPQAMYSDENTYGDTGGASRFFYCPKASKKDRNDGLEHIQPKQIKGRDEGQDKTSIAYKARPTERQNIHPTVKPTDLMAYLVRLVTPKGGTVLDPFMGSGSTGKASVREGFNFIGIEREDEYMEIAKTRIEHEQSKNKHREFFDEV